MMEVHGRWSETGGVVRACSIGSRAIIGPIASQGSNGGLRRHTLAGARTALGLIVVAVIGSSGLALPAVADSDGSQQPINVFCPVMTEEEVKPEFTTIFDGRVVGFCCEKCLAKFTANPDRYAERLPKLESKPPAAGPDHARDDTGANRPACSRDLDAHGDHAHADNAGGHEMPGGAGSHDHDEGNHTDAAKGIHDHEHGHAHGKGFFARLIGWLGKFHPPMVNFPVAMILGAALAEALLLATKRTFFVNAGRFCLWFGCVGAVVAAVFGWFYGGFHMVDKSWILTTHRWLGTTTAAWSVLLLGVGEQTFRRAEGSRGRYRALLIIGASLVVISAFFGGSLIYGVNHYAL